WWKVHDRGPDAAHDRGRTGLNRAASRRPLETAAVRDTPTSTSVTAPGSGTAAGARKSVALFWLPTIAEKLPAPDRGMPLAVKTESGIVMVIVLGFEPDWLA